MTNWTELKHFNVAVYLFLENGTKIFITHLKLTMSIFLYEVKGVNRYRVRWDKAGWIHAFMFFTPNCDPTSECFSRNQDSSDQATFFQSSIVQFWWSWVNCILRVLFLADRSGTRCGLLLLEPICFRVRRVVLQLLWLKKTKKIPTVLV